MTIVLTPRLLEFLMAEGYQFCLSKTLSINTSGKMDVALVLKPVKTRVTPKRLPNGFNNYYTVQHQLKLMAYGIDHTLAVVDLNTPEMRQYTGLNMHIN